MHTGRLWSSCISDGLESETLVHCVKHGRLHKQHLSPQLLEAAEKSARVSTSATGYRRILSAICNQ